MPSAYPLTWPTGWRRIPPGRRKPGQFNTKVRRSSSMNPDISYLDTSKLTIGQARDRVLEALRLLGIRERDIILSTNLQVRLDGLPRSGQRQPDDPGAAVYWKRPKDLTHRVMAVDQYTLVQDNLAAVAATLEAMRAIERHGGAVILERAFTGFAALPSPNDWRHVMGFEETPTFEIVKQWYKALAIQRHPDSGGNENAMSELNRALDEAKRELCV